jgi:tetratricopeptide (TPR) repeat protein
MKSSSSQPAAGTPLEQAKALVAQGGLLIDQGKFPEAADCYRKALELNADCAEAHFNLGNLLRAQGQWREAAACYQQTVRLLPAFALGHYNLGTTFVAAEEAEPAMECFRHALRLQPSLARAHTSLAELLLERGRRDEATRHCREALQHDAACVPALVAVAWHDLYPLTVADLARIQSLLADPRLSEYDASRLHFALGHVAERAGAYEDAFARFSQANELRRRVLRQTGKAFDPVWYQSWIDQIIATCDTAYFERVKGWGRDTERLVFVVGMPRSGTSLVEQVLASHPQVYGAGERKEIGQLVMGLMSRQASPAGYPGELDQPTLTSLADWYLQRIEGCAGSAARVIDKAPNNFQFLGLIAALFPQARIVHCRRDPRDVCLSCFQQDFTDWTLNLEELAIYYRQYERLMAHWRAVLPLPLLEVAYEELVEDLEGVSRRLVSFGGLEWDERCLAFNRTERKVRTASVQQVRQSVYKSSVGRWRHYAAHMQPLLEALGLPTS